LKTGRETSDHLKSCSYCKALLPVSANFCNSCGKQVKQKQNGEREADIEHSEEVREQEAKTIRLAAAPQIYRERWLSYQSRKNNALTGRSQVSNSSLQDVEELPTQPITSSRDMAVADTIQLSEVSNQIKPTLSSPTILAPSIPKISKRIPALSNLLWLTIIIYSVVAAGLVTFVFTDTIVRPVIVFWFLLVCPGMIVVRFLHLKEPVVEWTLSIALSFAIDAIVAAIQLFAGRWSPVGTLTILMSLSLCGAIVQLVTSTKSVPILLRTMRSRKLTVLVSILLILLIGIIVGMSLWSYEVYHGSRSATSTWALQPNATSYASPTSTGVSTPSSTSSVNLAKFYNGTIYDIVANSTTTMSLTDIQQTQIYISGNFTGLYSIGTFNGTIDSSKHIQFTVKDSTGHLNLSFDGIIQSDGDISGSYCSVDQNAQCTSEQGVWSIAPAS